MIHSRRLLLAFLLPAALLAVDPGLLNWLPAGTQFVAGIQVDQTRDSEFGQYLLQEMQKEEPQLRKLIDATGFDPRYDLREVLIAAGTGEQRKDNGLVVARGKFDAARITAFARQEGARATEYRGATVLTGPAEHERQWIAFPDATTAILGEASLVKAALDRKPGAGLTTALTARITQLSGRYDAWMVSTAGMGPLAGHVPDPNVNGALRGDLMQSVEQASGGVRFGRDVLVAAEMSMRSDRDATAMEDVARFLAGMMGNSRDARENEFASLLDTMKLTTEGRIFRLQLSLPQAQIEKLLRGARTPRKTARVH